MNACHLRTDIRGLKAGMFDNGLLTHHPCISFLTLDGMTPEYRAKKGMLTKRLLASYISGKHLA